MYANMPKWLILRVGHRLIMRDSSWKMYTTWMMGLCFYWKTKKERIGLSLHRASVNSGSCQYEQNIMETLWISKIITSWRDYLQKYWWQGSCLLKADKPNFKTSISFILSSPPSRSYLLNLLNSAFTFMLHLNTERFFVLPQNGL